MTDTADFFRARLDGMVDPLHPLVVLSRAHPWAAIEQALAPHFARKAGPGQRLSTRDLLGVTHEVMAGVGRKVCIHAVLPAEESGQLRFLGSITPGHRDRRAWVEGNFAAPTLY